MIVRGEQPEDAGGVRRVNETAFGRSNEADLVEDLRLAGVERLSLVAVDVGEVVGHILFTQVVLEHGAQTMTGMGLGPMAVDPARQREGIGSRLVEEGLAVLRFRKCPFVVVVGHPGYYPRFGFEPASLHGLASQWSGIPDDAFMALILDRGRMAGVAGTARYHDEFERHS